jgi:nucleoside-diphosphate-sugar epimerase
MSGPRVLVTGATGLIGRAVVAALAARGCEVVAASRSGRALGAAWPVAADLLEPGAAAHLVAEAEATHLVHLAWADGRDRWTSPANLDWVGATLSLARAFAAGGGERALFAGSSAEYDWTGPVRLSETSPLRPATLYGAAKAALSGTLAAAMPALGYSVVWARPFFVYGPGEPEGRLLGDLVRGLSAGRPVECTDGLQRRDYLSSADMGEAVAALLLSEAEGAVNIGSGEAIEVRALIGEVARAMGRPELVRLGARPRPDGDPAEIVADVSRLKAATGFRPRHDLASGVAALLAEAAVPA